ncbi:MAG: 3-oxoacyl-[acyl-carrier-protein] reductase [Deltaproteobacteria bacterium]|nr:3-oxoacyl-[acyl-carrier-protein] reductase [Deltaproteobacteria bacterium]
MLLKDEVAIVTGGTKGIGKAICLLFAEQGAKVIANFSKDVEAANNLEKEAKSRGLSVALYKADVTQSDQVKAMVEETFAQHGKIDILVNNVGLVRDNFLMLMSDEDWESLVKANLTSLFYCSRIVIRKMIPRRKGKIINISSISGMMGTPGQVNYAATKGGMTRASAGSGSRRKLPRLFSFLPQSIQTTSPGRPSSWTAESSEQIADCGMRIAD